MTQATTPRRVSVCRSEDVAERGRYVVQVGDLTIGLFRIKNQLYAYENTCPHQGGPVCQGKILGRVREHLDRGRTTHREYDEDELHIVCPWHGFEFSITTGQHPGDSGFSLHRIAATELDGMIHVDI